VCPTMKVVVKGVGFRHCADATRNWAVIVVTSKKRSSLEDMFCIMTIIKL